MKISDRRVWSMLALLTAAFLLFSCSEDDPLSGQDEELRIEAYSGDGQTERTGAVLPEPLTARVTDLTGNPRSGVIVDFATTAENAYVTPSATTDGLGLARATFALGTQAGIQTVSAAITDDITAFSATATTPECSEEYLDPACDWPPGNIYITTTSSDLIQGSGSALIEFDPVSEEVSLVLESGETFLDLAFSPRGELFVTTDEAVYKVDPVSHGLTSWYTFGAPAQVEIEPNFGSVLVIATNSAVTGLFCPSSGLSAQLTDTNIRYECLAVEPVSRAVWYATGTTISFDLVRQPWDGRTDFAASQVITQVNTGSGSPVGMCADSTGTVYVVLDGSASDRSIGRRLSDGTWDAGFFDLYALSTTGRYGDIACSDGRLYLIDKWNDALLVISTEGTLLESYSSTSFSDDFDHSERYGIAAAPQQDCQ